MPLRGTAGSDLCGSGRPRRPPPPPSSGRWPGGRDHLLPAGSQAEGGAHRGLSGLPEPGAEAADVILRTQTATGSVIFTSPAEDGAAMVKAGIMWMQMATVCATTMHLPRTADAASGGADNKAVCGANRRQSEPSNGIPIPFDGSAWYI